MSVWLSGLKRQIANLLCNVSCTESSNLSTDAIDLIRVGHNNRTLRYALRKRIGCREIAYLTSSLEHLTLKSYVTVVNFTCDYK